MVQMGTLSSRPMTEESTRGAPRIQYYLPEQEWQALLPGKQAETQRVAHKAANDPVFLNVLVDAIAGLPGFDLALQDYRNRPE
jgi:hypothetical protein